VIQILAMQTLFDLVVYQKAVELRKNIQRISADFPKHEEYSLKAQIKRSARSVPANIAEGYGRFHYQENIQFLRIARGSVFETVDHLGTASEEGFINNETKQQLIEDCLQLVKVINGYILYLKKRKTEMDE
jgi:four helix bundle protein